jgi:hypothetical protein
MKPDATPKRSLLQRPAEHLLTSQTQKMGVPNHEHANPNVGPRGHKRNPLSKPFREIVHAVHHGGINLIKVCLMGMGRFDR